MSSNEPIYKHVWEQLQIFFSSGISCMGAGEANMSPLFGARQAGLASPFWDKRKDFVTWSRSQILHSDQSFFFHRLWSEVTDNTVWWKGTCKHLLLSLLCPRHYGPFRHRLNKPTRKCWGQFLVSFCPRGNRVLKRAPEKRSKYILFFWEGKACFSE